jgi:hypothetical protein
MKVSMRIGKDGRLWVMGREVGEINKEVLNDEEVRGEVRRLLVEESKRVRRVMRMEKLRRIEEKYERRNV